MTKRFPRPKRAVEAKIDEEADERAMDTTQAAVKADAGAS
jgi:hypothetical protein